MREDSIQMSLLKLLTEQLGIITENCGTLWEYITSFGLILSSNGKKIDCSLRQSMHIKDISLVLSSNIKFQNNFQEVKVDIS